MQEIKLSKRQIEVVRLMKLGYKCQTVFGKPMLFKNGNTINTTFYLLEKLECIGIIDSKSISIQFERIVYNLTELGKTISLT